MFFVVIGVVLLAMKLGDWGPAAGWDWWWVLAPFGLALAWWQWMDASGMTRRREMQRDEDRKAERRQRHIDALGLGTTDNGKRNKQRR